MKNYKKVYYKLIPICFNYTDIVHEGITRARKIGVIESDDFHPFSIEISNSYYLLIIISFKKFNNTYSIIDYNECRPRIIKEFSTIIYLDVNDNCLKNTNSIYLGENGNREIITAGAIIAELITELQKR